MLATIVSLLEKILDAAILWYIIYQVLKYSRNNFKLTLIFKGVLLIILLKYLSSWLNLHTVGMLIEYVIAWGPLAIIIIFQPEIRNALESIGRSQLLGRHKTLTVDAREKMVYEIVNALDYLKKNKIEAVRPFAYPLHQYLKKTKEEFPATEHFYLKTILIPNYSSLSKADVTHITKIISTML